ncbi:MAG: hypothetical protein II871_05125 [Clostridia bacterium]|nr:hypothetical protein [Clostridia bacterium]
MNKDDLLKKAQEESGKTGFDEREQKLAVQGSAVAFSIGGMLCMLINLASYIFSGIDPLVGTTCWLIWTGMQAADCMFKAFKVRKKPFLPLGILYCVLFLGFVAIFVIMVIKK